MKYLIPLFCGILFGTGLALSGMTDTRIVLGFLDVFGAWNPTLLLVMCGALTVTIPGFYLVQKRPKPVCEDRFSMPTKRKIDGKLIAGSAIFGVGWGLYGYCPGPALAAVAYANLHALLFVLAMLAGMRLSQLLPD